jgi:tetratricopeptide (TPR) repeat protein
MVGDLDAAAFAFEDVLSATSDVKDWEAHLQAAIDLARVYQQAGDVEQSITVAEAALAQVDEFELTGSDVHARLASTLVGSYYLRGDLTKAGQVASRALAVVEPNAGEAAKASILWNASIVAHKRGDTEGALGLAEQAVAMYAEHKDRGSLARLQVTYAWLLLRTTPPQPMEARKLLRRAHKALSNEGTAVDLASCETEMAVAALLLGEIDEALSLVDKAYDRYGGIVTFDSAGTQLIRGRILLAARRKAQAERQYREAAKSLGQMEVSRAAASGWRELADAYTQLGLFEDAALAYQQALAEVGIRAEPGALPGAAQPTTSAADEVGRRRR